MSLKCLSAYQAIIFDWDGTLVDTCGLVLDAHNHVRQFYNLDLWSMEDFLGRASQSAREYYPTVYGDKADEAQQLLYGYVEGNHLKTLKAMSDAKALLDFIDTQNITMGVVSNKRHNTLNIEIDHMQWRQYFKTVIGAGVAPKDKPSADPLLMALETLEGNLKPQDILYVGDTETDLLCAQNAGCPIALIQSDKPRPDLIDKYKPDFAFDSVNDFIEEFTPITSTLNKAC